MGVCLEVRPGGRLEVRLEVRPGGGRLEFDGWKRFGISTCHVPRAGAIWCLANLCTCDWGAVSRSFRRFLHLPFDRSAAYSMRRVLRAWIVPRTDVGVIFRCVVHHSFVTPGFVTLSFITPGGATHLASPTIASPTALSGGDGKKPGHAPGLSNWISRLFPKPLRCRGPLRVPLGNALWVSLWGITLDNPRRRSSPR